MQEIKFLTLGRRMQIWMIFSKKQGYTLKFLLGLVNAILHLSSALIK